MNPTIVWQQDGCRIVRVGERHFQCEQAELDSMGVETWRTVSPVMSPDTPPNVYSHPHSKFLFHLLDTMEQVA